MAEVEQDRAAWLEWRRGGLGASDVAAVLGLSPWSSPWSLWADKVGLLGADSDDEAREFGRWAEHMIAPWFEHRTGLTVGCAQEQLVHPAAPWARCTLDGRVFDGPGWTSRGDCLGGLEIKTDYLSRRWETIPAYYQAQGQWQCHIGEFERVWFPVLHGRRLEIYELERDDADIEFLVETAEAFWNDHVLAGVPPDVDGSEATMSALAEVYPAHTPGCTVVLDDEGIEAVADLAAARAEKKRAEQAERAAKAIIAAHLADAEEGTGPGADEAQRLVSWRSQKRTDLDKGRLRAEHPDLYKDYETVTTMRVMRVPKEKK